MPTPFDSFSFSQNNENSGNVVSVSVDDLVRVLNMAGNPVRPGNPETDIPVQGGTSAGIDRVNKNNQGRNGIVAYKDEKGQAVLTNTSIDVTSGQKSGVNLKEIQKQLNPGRDVPQVASDTPNGILSTLAALRKTEDPAEARALYESLQNNLASEVTRLQNEAMTFAENKVGLAVLRQQLAEARLADQADPLYFPGAGDSKITQGILQEIRALSALADNEAQGFLKRNLSFNQLNGTMKMAEAEFQRVERNAERKAASEQRVVDFRESQKIQREENDRLRTQQKEDDVTRRNREIFEQIPAVAQKRIQYLSAEDFNKDMDADQMAAKMAAIVKGKSKDKNYQAAVSVEDPRELFRMGVVESNPVAKKLFIHEEAVATQRSEFEVEQELIALEKEFAKGNKAMAKMIARKEPDEKKRNIALRQIETGLIDAEQGVRANAQKARATLMLEYIQDARTARFREDATTWNLHDPMFIAAIDKSRKTAGKSDMQNVLAAFVGEAAGPERMARIAEFKKALKNAAVKYKDSPYGMPNYVQLETEIDRNLIESGFFGKQLGWGDLAVGRFFGASPR